MRLDPEVCYQALRAHDARFDGRFFVGVSSTGIYCRPVCPAKTPKRENCTFYSSAALAEQAGYRPCLRCRPELAPGNARIDSLSRLAAAAASRIEDGALSEMKLEELAAELGVSDRHLRRAVERELGVSPIELAQTQRLLLAKRLLTDTSMPIGEVAFASGFASLRRFNALFSERYRMPPTNLGKTAKRQIDAFVCQLAYKPPFDWEETLKFLGARATLGVEFIQDGQYFQTVAIGQHKGWIKATHNAETQTVRVEVSTDLAKVLPKVLSRVKRLFDLSADPSTILRHLGPIAEGHPGLRVPGGFGGFQMAVRAVLGQQVSVQAATTVSGRFSAKFGETIQTPFPFLTNTFPNPETVAALDPEQVVQIGMPMARARTIVELARAIADGHVALRPGVDVERTMAALTEIPGIGEWTAQYIAMRALGWPDAFPHTDLGIYKALGTKDRKKVLEVAEPWRPWRSYACMHLWKSLENV